MNSHPIPVRFSNGKLSILFAAIALIVVGIGCGAKTPPPSQYVGLWTGADGTTITIRADGSGDYKSANSSVSGGNVTIDETANTLKVALAGMGPTFKIDMSPSSNKMLLDGVLFKKSGVSTDPNADTSKPEIPSDEKLQTLAKTTFMEFGDAVQSADFTDFHKKVAKVWQDSTTPKEMKTAFKTFVDNKANFDFKKAVSPLDATFLPEPSIEEVSGLNALFLRGYYPTKPRRTYFELKYTLDDGTWKLISINVKTASD